MQAPWVPHMYASVVYMSVRIHRQNASIHQSTLFFLLLQLKITPANRKEEAEIADAK